MVRLLIKLAIVALLGNAAYRIGSEYLTYINFRDAVRDAAMFKARTDDELSQLVMALAEEYEIPLAEDELRIERGEREVTVQGSYRKPIEVAPKFVYDWPFSWDIRATVSYVVPPFAPRPER